MKYKYTKEMREISGMGGGYEQACREMVLAGLEWLEKNPTAKLGWKVFKNVYGLTPDKTPDTEKMVDYMVDKSGGDATGAMVQATLSHIWFIKNNGWEKYENEMKLKINNLL